MTAVTKRAFITGIHGFTGRYMENELTACGYEVFGMGTQAATQPNHFNADLTDKENLKRILADIQPDYVIHLAAVAFVGHGDPEAFYQINLLGTRNLLEAIQASGKTPECILIASSANIYGNSESEHIDESVLAKPANDYAVSKLAMEYMLSIWQDKLPIVITRPFNYTGVGQSVDFLLPKIVSHFKNATREIELGNLDVARDFSDVRMVINAYHKLLQAAPVGEVFNVCSGHAYTLQDILNIMAEIAGYQITVKVNPNFVRKNEVKRLCGSNLKLMNTIGQLELIPLQHTLRWMYEHEAKS